MITVYKIRELPILSKSRLIDTTNMRDHVDLIELQLDRTVLLSLKVRKYINVGIIVLVWLGIYQYRMSFYVFFTLFQHQATKLKIT